ncbi:MAG TPA: hypothetical protein VII45_03900 [Solirubrobacterales bacterium]
MSRAAPRRPDAGTPTAQRSAALSKANATKDAIGELKAEARSGRLAVAALLADPRAKKVRVHTLLPMVPRCTLRVAFEALLICQVNGARTCGDLSAGERKDLEKAVADVERGIVAAKPSRPARGSASVDRDLDRVLAAVGLAIPTLELCPSEFAAARSGLAVDPLLLRMVDRLVQALRLYIERDDGGERARVVLGQWIRYRHYLSKVAAGEYPPPTQRGPAALE